MGVVDTCSQGWAVHGLSLSCIYVRQTSFLTGLSLVYIVSSVLLQWPYLLMCHIKVTDLLCDQLVRQEEFKVHFYPDCLHIEAHHGFFLLGG